MTSVLLALALAVSPLVQAVPPQPAEVIAEIQVHGNHVTPDAAILALAGIAIGATVMANVVEQVSSKLISLYKYERCRY